MSEKRAKEKHLAELTEDRDKAAGKIIALKVHCQNHPEDATALHRLVRLIDAAKAEVSKDVTL